MRTNPGGKILLCFILGVLVSLVLTGPMEHLGATVLYTLLMTGFFYGFGSVKDALLGVLAKADHYSLSAIFLRSLAGGIIVFLIATLALGVLFYGGVACGYIRMAKDVYLCLSGPPRKSGSYESIDLEGW